MDKKELIIFGLFTIIAILILVQTFRQPEQIEQPAPRQIEPVPELPKEIPEVPEIPEHEIPNETYPFPTPPIEEPETPTKQELTPAYAEFHVNRITVPPYFAASYIPIYDDDIKTYSGKFGPYFEDMREHMYVELCKHVRDMPDQYVCEKVRDLNYIDSYISFVRGYPADEFIGAVAMRHFSAYYVVMSKEHGTIAKSNLAPIRLVKS